MKKIIGMIVGSALLYGGFIGAQSYDMSVCNVVTAESVLTGKQIIGVKWSGMGTEQGVKVEKAFTVDASTCIYNDHADSAITLYLVDESYINQIGGVDKAAEWNISAQGNITDNRFLKIAGNISATEDQMYGDGVNKITHYYQIASTQEGYELVMQSEDVNDGNEVTVWNEDMRMQKAVSWLYQDAKATKYSTVAEFGADRSITREEAAKFFSQVKMHWSDNEIAGDFSCTFSDINSADSTLRASIAQACKLGIMKGGNGLFTPKNQVTVDQALVVAMRMYTGKMSDEAVSPWYKNYLTHATEAGLFTDGMLSANITANAATRGWVAMLLYKAHLSAQK